MEIISANALISINETFFVQLVSFLIFIFILNKVMLKPLRSTAEQRIEHIKRVKQDIKISEKKLNQFTVDLEKEKSAAMDEAHAITDEMYAKAGEKTNAIFSEARAKVITLRDAAEKDVNEKVSAARVSLEEEAETLTTIIMEKVLDRRLVK